MRSFRRWKGDFCVESTPGCSCDSCPATRFLIINKNDFKNEHSKHVLAPHFVANFCPISILVNVKPTTCTVYIVHISTGSFVHISAVGSYRPMSRDFEDKVVNLTRKNGHRGVRKKGEMILKSWALIKLYKIRRINIRLFPFPFRFFTPSLPFPASLLMPLAEKTVM